MVTSHLLKIMEKMVLFYYKKSESKILEVGDYQAGFKEGSMTHNNLVKVFKSISITRRRRTQRKVYLFVDLKKAYDSVIRKKLWEVLYRRCENENDESIVDSIRMLHRQSVIEYGDKSF